MDLDFEIALLCDDVRREQSGKDILIGVYAGDVLVPQLPIQIPIACWLLVKPKKTGDLEFDLRIKAPGSAPPFEMKVVANVSDSSEPFAFFSPPIGIRIESEGSMQIFGKPKSSQKWKNILTKKIVYRPVSASLAAQLAPPSS